MNPNQPDEPVPDHSATIRHRWPQPQPTPPPQHTQPPQPTHPPQGQPQGQPPYNPQGQPQYQSNPHQAPPYQQQGPPYGMPQQPPQPPPETRRLDYTPDLLPPVPDYEPVRAPKSAWWWVIVVGGVALVIAILAVAVILWGRSSTASALPQTQQQQQGGPRVTDAKSHVSYALPDGWKQTKDGLVDPFTSSAGPKKAKDKDEGAVVVAFPQGQKVAAKPTPEQLQAQVKSVAFRNAEFFMPQEGSREALTTRSLEIGGRPAATASFRIVFKDATRSPAYVRTVLIFTADDSISYVFGSTAPDGKADRAAIDQVMDSVRPV